MIKEGDVVDSVAEFLAAKGWQIISKCGVKQKGCDIVAIRDSIELRVEAKGATSSDESSSRFGKPFSGGQVFDHVAKAVLKALRAASAEDIRSAIALPDDELHRREINLIGAALAKVDIGIFWVSDARTVLAKHFELGRSENKKEKKETRK